MSNDYYSHVTGVPATSSQGSSSAIRAELDSIAAAFDKLPPLTGNGDEFVAVNSGGSALTSKTAADVLTAIGAQPLDAQLTALADIASVATLEDIAGLTPSDGVVIVGDGANFVAESGATARSSLGLGTAAVATIGTAGDTVPKCNTANTFSETQQISQVGNAAPAYYNLLSDSGQNALHYVHDGIIQRWGFGKQDTTSDFVIYRYNSSGAFQGTPFFIEEDTGYVNFSGYTGSTDTNTDYPIGTLLSVYVSTAPYARNASNGIKYTAANNYSFTHAAGTGTTLTGTWRARGVSGIANQSGTVEYYQMFQRTA